MDVVVERFGQASSEFTMPLLDTSPGIFTAAQVKRGEAIYKKAGSSSNASNPNKKL